MGTSPALEALEPSFHQDLNGDGLIRQSTRFQRTGMNYWPRLELHLYKFKSILMNG